MLIHFVYLSDLLLSLITMCTVDNESYVKLTSKSFVWRRCEFYLFALLSMNFDREGLVSQICILDAQGLCLLLFR